MHALHRAARAHTRVSTDTTLCGGGPRLEYILQANRTGHTHNMNDDNTRPNNQHTQTTPTPRRANSVEPQQRGRRLGSGRGQPAGSGTRRSPTESTFRTDRGTRTNALGMGACVSGCRSRLPSPSMCANGVQRRRAPRLALLALGRGGNLAKLEEHHRQHPANLRGVRTRV